MDDEFGISLSEGVQEEGEINIIIKTVTYQGEPSKLYEYYLRSSNKISRRL